MYCTVQCYFCLTTAKELPQDDLQCSELETPYCCCLAEESLRGMLTVCTVQYSTVQYSTVQYSTVQCSTVQCCTVQCSTMQYSTVQYSTVRAHPPGVLAEGRGGAVGGTPLGGQGGGGGLGVGAELVGETAWHGRTRTSQVCCSPICRRSTTRRPGHPAPSTISGCGEGDRGTVVGDECHPVVAAAVGEPGCGGDAGAGKGGGAGGSPHISSTGY